MDSHLLTIHKYYGKGKKIHGNDIGDQPDLFIGPLVVSSILFIPILLAGIGLMNIVEWLGALLILLGLGLSIYGYYAILGFVNG
ncbi:hypothetical protein DJ68_17120 [Halorubrum sp. C3]|nr:hypothetical protein DJ68_17120 [Halorubrum sp. C3]